MTGWEGGPLWREWRRGGAVAGLSPFKAVATPRELQESIAVPTMSPPASSLREKPVIQTRKGALDLTATEAETALLASGLPIFRRGDALVRPACWEAPVADGRTTMTAGMKPIGAPALMDLLSQAATWVKWDGRAGKLVPADPPPEIVSIVLSRAGYWNFPPLAGVTTTPILRRDGNVLTTAGYDPENHTYLMPDYTCRIPGLDRTPTRRDAEKGLDLLRELLVEFPLVGGKGGTAEAVALSGLVSPVARGALGAVPLHAWSAPVPGSGKSYLTDLASVIATGRRCPVAAASHDRKETEARIVGLLLAGYPITSIDNVSAPLGGDTLCQAVEQPSVRLRPLGTSDFAEIEIRSVWYANGNNLSIEGDMGRRTLYGQLDPEMERPEERVFKRRPLELVAADRGVYIGACLDIVRAYIAAGRPGKARPLASYEEWSDLVRSSLIWLGCGDAVASMLDARQSDDEATAFAETLAAWFACFGETEKTAVEVCREIMAPAMVLAADELKARLKASLAFLEDRHGHVSAVRLGTYFRSRQKRVVQGLRLTHKRDENRKINYWMVKLMAYNSIGSKNND